MAFLIILCFLQEGDSTYAGSIGTPKFTLHRLTWSTSHKETVNHYNYREHESLEDKSSFLLSWRPTQMSTEYSCRFENVCIIVFSKLLWIWILNNYCFRVSFVIISVSEKKADLGTQRFHPILRTYEFLNFLSLPNMEERGILAR